MLNFCKRLGFDHVYLKVSPLPAKVYFFTKQPLSFGLLHFSDIVVSLFVAKRSYKSCASILESFDMFGTQVKEAGEIQVKYLFLLFWG